MGNSLGRDIVIDIIVGAILNEMRKNRIKILLAEHSISAKDLALKIGKEAQTLRRYVRHEAEPRLEMANAIAEALGVSVDEVLGVDEITQIKTEKNRMLPVYGAAEGGEGFDITNVTEPIDAIEAPPYLVSSPTAYAVYVAGDSMEPRYNAGEILFVHPGKPVKAGDSVVVQFSNGGNDHAMVKTYKKMDNDKIYLSQYNPQKNLTFPRKTVKNIHKIVGTVY